MNKKIIVSVFAVAFAFSMVGSAGAVTLEELETLYADLLAKYQLLLNEAAQPTTTTGLCLSGELSLGMTSTAVKTLQQGLNQDPVTQVAVSGAGSPGYETSYFGGLTKAAVIKFQEKYASEVLASWGFTKGTGYAGQTTIAKFNALYCTPVAPTTTTTVAPESTTTTTTVAALTGGAGSAAYELSSGLSNEEVGEGENDVAVAGLEIEADESSDLKLTAVQLTFVQDGGNAADRDFDKYADEVSVWLGSNEVARVDADVFDDDNEWTKTVTLSGDTIIAAEATGILYVKVSGINNLDSNDRTETWTVDYTAIRWMDAQGVTVSEDPTEDAVEFSFETYATSANMELKIALDDETVNEAHVIDIHATDDTDNVSILSFTMEVEGNSDITIDDLPINFVSTGADVHELISTAYLYMDGDRVGSENTAVGEDTDETITFDNLDLILSAGKTYKFIVKADFKSIADTNVDAGDTLLARILEAQRNAIDAEDETGEDLANADKTGTANNTAEAHVVYDEGITVSFVGVTAVKTAGDPAATTSDSGTFTITFDVTAFDGDAYIDHTAPTVAGGTTESDLDVTGTGTVTAMISSPTSATDDTEGFLVEEDSTEQFTITTNILATVSGYFDVALTDLLYALTNIDGDVQYTFNLDDYKTASLYLYAY